MKNCLVILTFLIIAVSCNLSKKEILKESNACNAKKELIQKQFEKKNYDSTICLFKDFKNCFLKELAYYTKLGLLYKINDQDSMSKVTFDELIEKLEKEDFEMNQDQVSLYKARIFSFQNNRSKVKEELVKIEKSNLNRTEKKEFKFLESYLNMGEFLAFDIKIEFELFE
jgi:hypothetical protein